MKNFFLSSISFFFLLGCASKSEKYYYAPHTVSMIQVIANPQKFNKRKICIKGYFVIRHEEYVIYTTKTDYDNLLFKNGIYLALIKDELKEKGIEPPLHGYIYIAGTYNSDISGPYGNFSGGLEDITLIYRLGKRDSPNEDDVNME